jgi:hypothetical protein
MTKVVPDQTRLALYSCFQSNNVGKTFSKNHSYIEITAPTAVGGLRFPDTASAESEETWVSQPTAMIRLR